MEKPRICIDLDNVIAKTDEVMRRVILEYTKGRVCLRYEDINRFNYWECTDEDGNSISKEDWCKVHEIFSQQRYILSIEPYPCVQRYVKRLAQAFDLHIVTSRLSTARKATIEWLENHAFPPHDLHFVKHRQKHKILRNFAVSIEDDMKQAEDFAELGTVSYILAHPWNEITQGSKSIRLPHWESLMREILKLSEK
jgi:5'(3')-deoxyribonucleotidase